MTNHMLRYRKHNLFTTCTLQLVDFLLMFMQAKFIERRQALLHGDMHTGSLMVTQDTTYAIDAEFAVYGPIAFDVGKFMANLLLAFFALDGHSSGADTRSKQRGWLYQVAAHLLFVAQCMTQQS